MTPSALLSQIESTERSMERLQQRRLQLKKKLGRSIQSVRYGKRIKQCRLAEAAETTAPTLCNIENGVFNGSTKLYRRIISILKKA